MRDKIEREGWEGGNLADQVGVNTTEFKDNYI